MHWIRRITLGLAGLVVLALIVGAASEQVIRRRVSTKFPAAGRLIEIGGRSIQLDCRGTGSPTVVLEAGLDVLGSLSWATVHDSLAAMTRTCAYSRAGILWSGRSDRPFSVNAAVADLRLTLDKAGERAPFLMVGHSIGGLYATAFTRRFRADVAGLVLVDASHPDQIARLEASTGVTMLPPSRPLSVAARLAGTGILRFLPESADPSTAPVAVRSNASAHLPTSVAALASETRGLHATFAETRSFRALGDLPLVVLTAGAPTPPAALQQMGMSRAQGERMRTEWIAMQMERSTWTSHGRHVLLPDASHYVQFDRPDAVVSAVREIIGQVQTRSTGRVARRHAHPGSAH
jgi:pimeloyl-ACP methyl ester carboxylesterase